MRCGLKIYESPCIYNHFSYCNEILLDHTGANAEPHQHLTHFEFLRLDAILGQYMLSSCVCMSACYKAVFYQGD